MEMEMNSFNQADKKVYVQEVGEILVKTHGKKKYYSPEEVKKLHRKANTTSIGTVGLCAYSVRRSTSTGITKQPVKYVITGQ